ncbi:DUF4251 domain-containing protein [Gramella sp. AN32]|uniref:DUF4251 domain-containing protein n=1 Tax=Christiangramia antarctica TaxID=2058158 RepID=A0ABW5WYZ2_9FLAO|nr:DUF4251 domain-containing protein [Gramella sp. AN32]MCM4156822.1 hypothetical protein [Gramella sp. AN32]
MKKNKLKYFPFLLIAVCAIFILSCGTGKDKYSEAEYAKLRELIENESFEISHLWALPLRGGQVNLIGNPNYIRIYHDSVEVDLPYFGVRQMGGGYNSTAGFEYKGTRKNFEMKENQRNGGLVLKFETIQDSETVDYIVTLFPEGKANTQIISAHRDNISFQGTFDQYNRKD